MRAVLVEIVGVGPCKPNRVALVEHDHVIEEFAAAPADPAFGHRILPGTSIGDAARLRAHRLDEPNYGCAEDGVAVEDQMPRRDVVALMLWSAETRWAEDWVHRTRTELGIPNPVIRLSAAHLTNASMF